MAELSVLLARAQASGLPVYEADFSRLDPQAFPAVKIVVFDNVLEHLPSLASVEEVFQRACAIASHVVYIRHPSFEHEEYLASLGLKQYWTDWPGVHTAPKEVILDSPENINRHARLIEINAVRSSAMPPGNVTEITAEERQILAAWLAAGAPAK